jgi:hypothetical protein
VERRILPGGYFFIGAYFQCSGESGPIPRQIRQAVRDWVDVLAEALRQARRRDEIRSSIDAVEAAIELTCVLIGAQWSQLMAYTDHEKARLTILDHLRKLATEEVPDTAFESVEAWQAYLEGRAD